MGLKIQFVVILVLVFSGCATPPSTIHSHVTSIPPGAQIYQGPSPTSLKNTNRVTPSSTSFTGSEPYYKNYYYQVKKEGFEDSEIKFKPEGPVGFDRHVHFDLIPLGETEGQPVVIESTQDEKPAKPEENKSNAGYVPNNPNPTSITELSADCLTLIAAIKACANAPGPFGIGVKICESQLVGNNECPVDIHILKSLM